MVFANAMYATLMLSNPALVGPQPLDLGTSVDEIEQADDDLDVDVDVDVDDTDEDSASDLEPQWQPEPAPGIGAASGAPGTELRARRKWDGTPYFSLGLAPMSSLHMDGFHPGVRYDIEAGLTWERGRARIWVGPDLHISKYYGRKKPSVGVDAMMTLSFKHVYGRVGAGTISRMPARPDVDDTRPMMGGLVGAGLVGRLDHVEGRIGVDYDLRIDTTGRVAQTVMVAMRLSFGP